MSDRLLVATRKGLFETTRGSGGWTLSGPSFLGTLSLLSFPIRVMERFMQPWRTATLGSSFTAPLTAGQAGKNAAPLDIPASKRRNLGRVPVPQKTASPRSGVWRPPEMTVRVNCGPEPFPEGCFGPRTGARPGN